MTSRDKVWASYQLYHPTAVLDARRKKLIDARLKEFPVETLVAAVEGNHRDPYCCGKNDLGRSYHSLELILRSADKVEQYAEVIAPKPRAVLAREEEDDVVLVPPPPETLAAIKGLKMRTL